MLVGLLTFGAGAGVFVWSAILYALAPLRLAIATTLTGLSLMALGVLLSGLEVWW